MLNTCFSRNANPPKAEASRRLLTEAPAGLGFEPRAFAALFANKKKLGIKDVWRCYAARIDGFLETVEGEIILLEMKERLSWGSVQAAGFQFLAGRRICGLNARRGLIVFEREAEEWKKLEPHGAWGQLALHALEFSENLDVAGLQILPDGSLLNQAGVLVQASAK